MNWSLVVSELRPAGTWKESLWLSREMICGKSRNSRRNLFTTALPSFNCPKPLDILRKECYYMFENRILRGRVKFPTGRYSPASLWADTVRFRDRRYSPDERRFFLRAPLFGCVFLLMKYQKYLTNLFLCDKIQYGNGTWLRCSSKSLIWQTAPTSERPLAPS